MSNFHRFVAMGLALLILFSLSACKNMDYSVRQKNPAQSNPYEYTEGTQALQKESEAGTDVTIPTEATPAVYEAEPRDFSREVVSSPEAVTAFVEGYKEETAQYVYDTDTLLHSNQYFWLGTDFGLYRDDDGSNADFCLIVHAFDHPKLRSTKTGLYLVYDTREKYRLFLFFSREKSQCTRVDGYPVLSGTDLCYKDFSGIDIGDTLDEIVALDQSTAQHRIAFGKVTDQYLTFYQSQYTGSVFSSVHILTDGAMKIEYERKDGSYFITKILYSPDFILDGINGSTCYKILPEDYVEG